MSSSSAATSLRPEKEETAIFALGRQNKFLEVESQALSTAPRGAVVSPSEFLAHSNRFIINVQAPTIDMNTRFVSLEDWEGQVLEISEDKSTFVSGLINLASGERIDTDEAVFAFEDVQPFQRDLVRPGAFFQWSVGWRYIGKSREKSSRLSFRRLPAWTKAELDALDKKAADFADLISAPQI
jgi:hypothetical protein